MYTKRQIITLTEGRYNAPRTRALDATGQPVILNYQHRRSPLGHALMAPDELPEGSHGAHLLQLVCRLDPGLSRYSVSRIRHQVVDVLDERLYTHNRGHELGFWLELEEWHACDANFTSFGLSHQGRHQLKQLRERWSTEAEARTHRARSLELEIGWQLPRSEKQNRDK